MFSWQGTGTSRGLGKHKEQCVSVPSLNPQRAHTAGSTACTVIKRAFFNLVYVKQLISRSFSWWGRVLLLLRNRLSVIMTNAAVRSDCGLIWTKSAWVRIRRDTNAVMRLNTHILITAPLSVVTLQTTHYSALCRVQKDITLSNALTEINSRKLNVR